ncbi:MAG: crossover junction endodeoxyribonuclease RuvC [Rickettsiaceae bacterium]
MKILGIDPALTSLGWGLIMLNSPKINYIASGLVKTKSTELMHKRLYHIVGAIENIIETYNPDLIAMEETFINKNAVSSLKLGYVRGAVMSLIGKFDKPYFEYNPNLIKKTVVGAGHAEKHQMAHMIKLIVSGTHNLKNLDEVDALAVAYTCSVLFTK